MNHPETGGAPRAASIPAGESPSIAHDLRDFLSWWERQERDTQQKLARALNVAALQMDQLESAGVMDAQKIIDAHAERLGLLPVQLREVLLSHVAAELRTWATEQEEADPGSVWHTGDAPDWLEPYLERLRPSVEAF